MRCTFTVALILCLPIVIGGSAWAQIDYGDPSIYGTPVNLGPVINTFDVELYPSLSADELSLVFSRGNPDFGPPGTDSNPDLWMATRSSKNDPWEQLMRLGPEINSRAVEVSASLTGDGLELYIGRYNPPFTYSTWLATRASQDGPWTRAKQLPSPDANTDVLPRVSSDGLSLFVSGYYPGDNFVRTRDTREDPWGNPVRLGREINTARGESPGALSADGLSFFFTREHGNDWRSYDTWVSQRDTLSSPWGPPIMLPEPVNALDANDDAPWLSPDGTTLYFNSDRPGGQGSFDLWQVPIITKASQPQLEAGDANHDLKFDQLDLVQVQIAAKYLTGQTATWGEGDWNGAPGGSPGNPPNGNGLFDQVDIVAALSAGKYLTGPYAALAGKGAPADGQTSISYNPVTGELAVDAPANAQLTSINIDSAAGIFTGNPAQNLGGSFDNDADNNIFKATFGSSFGSLSFGNVAQAGLSEQFVSNDLTVVGSLAGGGDLGNVDLIYVPEPSTIALLAMGLLSIAALRRPAKQTVHFE